MAVSSIRRQSNTDLAVSGGKHLHIVNWIHLPFMICEIQAMCPEGGIPDIGV
jgi:hypothetical protein